MVMLLLAIQGPVSTLRLCVMDKLLKSCQVLAAVPTIPTTCGVGTQSPSWTTYISILLALSIVALKPGIHCTDVLACGGTMVQDLFSHLANAWYRTHNH